ncbi:MAG: TetR/AcrR family transcriptional regulator, partial [Bacteroidota bacterium]
MALSSTPDTRESIIDLADKLIRQKGYNAFSYKDIAAPLNIRNAAVHYHFPTKADLGKAVIARTREKFHADCGSWEGSSPTQQLQAFMQLYEHNRQESLVCFMGAMGPAYDTLPEPMQ